MKKFLCTILFLFYLILGIAVGQTTGSETECYTANGADYEGTQGQIEAPTSTPKSYTPCVKWSETGISEFENLTENYCRNPNNNVFPWCFVRQDGQLTRSLCHIPSCKTPAYVGCYKTMISSSSLTQGPSQYVPILQSNDTSLEDPKMKISRCLNYCRVRKHDYAGLTRGHSCFCGGWNSAEEGDSVLNDVGNKLPSNLCLQNHCVDDPIHACGGKSALAIYDTNAGRCGGSFKFKDYGTIYSPRWPGNYQHNQTCNWQIFIPGQYLADKENYNITFSFVYFNLQPKKDVLTIHTFRNFFDRSPMRISRHHGKNLPDDITISLRDVTYLMVGFKSDGEKAREGFTMNFKVISANPIVEEKKLEVEISEKETECYTANGADYQGTQSQIEAPLTTPSTFTPCLKWADVGIKEFENLTENYCRNPNNSVFPWCFIRINGVLSRSLCHIPSCRTPAYTGCYKTIIPDGSSTQGLNQYVSILQSNDTLLTDPNMRIARCLNYCRVRKHDYAGLTVGHSCYCGGWNTAEEADSVLEDRSNKLPSNLCLQNHCTGDPVHACGGKNAMAIYDTNAGRCGGSFKFKDYGTIYSPRWPGNYHHNQTCNWQIFAPAKYLSNEVDYNITFSFVYFNLQPKKDVLTIHTFRNFFDRSPIRISRHHGNNLPDDVTISLSDVTYLMVGFKSDGETAREGFTLNFKVIPATTSGNTESPEAENNRDVAVKTNVTETAVAKPLKNNEGPEVRVTTTLTTKTASTLNPGVAPHKQSNIAVVAIGVVIAVVVVTLAAVAGLYYVLKRRQKKKLSDRFTQPPPDFNNPVTFDNDLKTVDVFNHNCPASEIRCVT